MYALDQTRRLHFVVGTIYVAAFLSIDAASRLVHAPPGVAPWFLPVGLTMALLLGFGLRFVPLVFGVALVSNYFIRDLPAGPLGLTPLFLGMCSTSCYAAAAAFLLHGVRIDCAFGRLHDVAWFAVATFLPSSIMGLVHATTRMGAGLLPRADLPETIRNFVVGDTVGIFSVAPALLVSIIPWSLRRFSAPAVSPPGELRALGNGRTRSMRLAEWSAWAALIALSLWLALGSDEESSPDRLYLAFIPLIGVTMRHGIVGSAVCAPLINLAATAAVWMSGSPHDLAGLQLFMLALTMTGLFLGAAVTERSAARGNATHAVMAAHDLTERAEAERARRKTEDMYRRAIAAAGAVPYVRDYSGEKEKFLFMGEDIVRITGYTAEEMTPQLWDSIEREMILAGETRGMSVDEAVRRLRAGELQQWRSDSRIVAKDGSERWVSDASIEIEDDEGKPVGCIGTFMDITERKQAEDALRQSEERLDLALRGAELGLWDWNFRDNTVTANERLAGMVEYTIEELGSDARTWYALIHPADFPAAKAALQAHLQGETPLYEAEYRMRTKSGGWRWILDRGMVVERGPAGEPWRGLGTHLDITPRKEAEEDRRRLEQQVQHAQKLESLGVLAGGIAHDFNNLLVGILGNADLALVEMESFPQGRQHLEAIVTAAQQAAELCKQMLAYSGRGRFVVQPIDLSEVVREMAHLLSVSVSKKALLSYDFAENLPPAQGDVTQIRQVIMNLITNASEALGKKDGVISISTRAQECDKAYLAENYLGDELPAGLYVALEIADTGCGMDAETQKRLFDPFFTTKFTGRGLGMAAVLGIVRGHKGTIKVASEVGKGTTFTVLFPACEKPAHGDRKAEAVSESAWHASGTVLVADDESSVRDIAKKVLERIGLSVLCARDGREAIEIFKEHADDISLVILDMTMPHLGGEETFGELRKIRPDVRVILSSGYNEPETTTRFSGNELAGFLQKPYRAQSLVQTVRRVLET